VWPLLLCMMGEHCYVISVLQHHLGYIFISTVFSGLISSSGPRLFADIITFTLA